MGCCDVGEVLGVRLRFSALFEAGQRRRLLASFEKPGRVFEFVVVLGQLCTHLCRW